VLILAVIRLLRYYTVYWIRMEILIPAVRYSTFTLSNSVSRQHVEPVPRVRLTSISQCPASMRLFVIDTGLADVPLFLPTIANRVRCSGRAFVSAQRLLVDGVMPIRENAVGRPGFEPRYRGPDPRRIPSYPTGPQSSQDTCRVKPLRTPAVAVSTSGSRRCRASCARPSRSGRRGVVPDPRSRVRRRARPAGRPRRR